VLRARLEASTWEPQALEEVIRGYAKELSVGAGKVIHPLRVAVTGRDVSPGIFEVLAFLGRVKVLARLDAAIVRLEGR
jgi:glutamyl-tRNA synthetase